MGWVAISHGFISLCLLIDVGWRRLCCNFPLLLIPSISRWQRVRCRFRFITCGFEWRQVTIDAFCPSIGVGWQRLGCNFQLITSLNRVVLETRVCAARSRSSPISLLVLDGSMCDANFHFKFSQSDGLGCYALFDSLHRMVWSGRDLLFPYSFVNF